MKHTKTLNVRVRDQHCLLLKQMARSVNFVWNAIKERGMFLSAYDVQKSIQGAHKELGLHSHKFSRQLARRADEIILGGQVGAGCCWLGHA